jgi:L-ascorbate metabolism protein UlaG (beta-lactamase superfamily)
MKVIAAAFCFVCVCAGTIFLYASTDYGSQFGRSPGKESLQKMKSSPNHDGKRFMNTTETNLDPGFRGYVSMMSRWILGREVRVPDQELEVVRLGRDSFDEASEGLRVTWFGHSSALIEIEGRRILTDPVWSKRCSPSSVMGPARFHPPPIALDELPSLDAVIISHDHYDHLDKESVVSLAGRGVLFIMPLGVGSHLERWGIGRTQIVELDWWESTKAGGIEIIATPARHFSGRGFRDRNTTLWSSWVFRGKRHNVFFSGDTGNFPGLADIGKRFGPFDITMIKIGAYDQLWPDIHLNPEEAVEAHRVLRGDVLLPIHWGTFNLAYHDWFDPPERLVRAASEKSVPYAALRPGESVTYGSTPPVQPWWREYTER